MSRQTSNEYRTVPYEEEYDDDYSQMNADEAFDVSMTFSDLVEQCVIPVLSQVYEHFKVLFLLCFIFNLLHHALYKGVSLKMLSSSAYTHILNIVSVLFGLITLHTFYNNNCIFIIIIIITIFPLILLTQNKCKSHSGFIVSSVIVIYLVTCEVFIVDSTAWHNIRGTQMIVCMKLISYSFDITTSPSILSYLSYVLNHGSLILGPWIPLQDHVNNLAHPSIQFFDFWWVMNVIKSATLALSCLIVSTCLSVYVLSDPSIWLAAYRDALSFRFSHYFVCLTSQLTLLLMGASASPVVRVASIEVPRSLSNVVSVWNMPMHKFLKQYIFKTCLPYGSGMALLCTYLSSCLLHGFNLQLSAVLLSLGLFTYIEHKMREKLAEWMDACVLSKWCKSNCKHKHQSGSATCILTNGVLTIATLVHLSYLGLMFDSSQSQQEGYSLGHTFSKWSQFYFSSHFFFLFLFILYLLL